MRNFKIYFSGLIIIMLIFCCKNGKQDSGDCKGTTVSTSSTGYDNQIKSSVEYYNTYGFLKRIEMSFFDSNNDYYDTYMYDSDNKIMEFFRSNEGYSKYFYDVDLKMKTEYYDLNMKIAGYYTYEYLDNKIVNQKAYTSEGLDTTVNYYYHSGLLDSIVTIKPRLSSSNYFEKVELKYNANGNMIERLVFSNYGSENIELKTRYIYTYDNNSNKIKYELRDKDGNLVFGTYYRYLYDNLGNLVKTEIYDSNDNKIDSSLTEYQDCIKIKLIKPEL